MTAIRLAFAAMAMAATAVAAVAQEPAKPAAPAAAAARPPTPPPTRPGLLFKEEWKQNPKGDEQPLSLTASLANPDLTVTVYGPGAALAIAGKDGDDNNPAHLWSGDSKSPAAFTFKSKTRFADLTGLSRVKVNTKVSGFHKVYPVVRLADGTWWIGDRAAGSSTRDWNTEEISFPDVHWTKLDIATVTTKGNPVDKIDLGKVDEIGFADLIPGSGHGPGGWFDVAQVEVYGKGVAR